MHYFEAREPIPPAIGRTNAIPPTLQSLVNILSTGADLIRDLALDQAADDLP